MCSIVERCCYEPIDSFPKNESEEPLRRSRVFIHQPAQGKVSSPEGPQSGPSRLTLDGKLSSQLS